VSTATVVPEQGTAYGQIVTESAVSTPDQRAVVENTEAAVRSYFHDIPVMIQVARCESTFRHTLADGSVLRGLVDNADTGVMQINKRYHLAKATSMGLNLEDLQDNMAYARHLYETQGVQPWNASRPCWGNTLAMN
jgi:hypothetical protein